MSEDRQRKPLRSTEETCDHCNGSKVEKDRPCPKCWGTGKIKVWHFDEKALKLDISNSGDENGTK